MPELSPAAQAVLDAFNREARPEPHHQREAIAAALEALADQVAPSDAADPRNYLPVALECQRIRREILAIAAELEGSNG